MMVARAGCLNIKKYCTITRPQSQGLESEIQIAALII